MNNVCVWSNLVLFSKTHKTQKTSGECSLFELLYFIYLLVYKHVNLGNNYRSYLRLILEGLSRGRGSIIICRSCRSIVVARILISSIRRIGIGISIVIRI